MVKDPFIHPHLDHAGERFARLRRVERLADHPQPRIQRQQARPHVPKRARIPSGVTAAPPGATQRQLRGRVKRDSREMEGSAPVGDGHRVGRRRVRRENPQRRQRREKQQRRKQHAAHAAVIA